MAVQTRNEILDAADRLFGQVGFDAATTREIAELSGANKALIHYHFGGKDGLLDGVLDRYYARLQATVAEALSRADTFAVRLAHLVDAYIDFLAANPNFFRIVQREAAGGRHMPQIVARMTPIMQLGLPAIASELPPATGHRAAEHLAVTFYGAIIAWFTYAPVLEALLGRDPLNAEVLAERKRHIHWLLQATLDRIHAEANAPDRETEPRP